MVKARKWSELNPDPYTYRVNNTGVRRCQIKDLPVI